ncbi:MAG: hypothetical protein LYZ69_00530 [Nitrososphaerales archaeon]|nr:hypothetical protein [Nitrososphaerales archaeon]
MVKLRPRPKSGKGSGRITKPLIALGIPAALLTVVIVVALIPRGPEVLSLPSQIPFKEQAWMTYVPTDATLVRFYNFSRIVSSPGAQYAIQNNTLIRVYDTGYNVSVDQALYSFEVSSRPGGGVDVFALKPEAYHAFYNYASSSLQSQSLGGYQFFVYRENSSAVIRVYAVFRDGMVFQATGGPSAYRSVVKVLQNHDGNLPNFFSTQERHAEYYLASTTEAKMMGFSVLPSTTVAGTHEWVAAVYDATDTIGLANFYAYNTQQNATQMYQTAATEILSPNFANSYIIGNFIVQTRSFPWSQARTPINSL